jgi:hypothetical protein
VLLLGAFVLPVAFQGFTLCSFYIIVILIRRVCL